MSKKAKGEKKLPASSNLGWADLIVLTGILSHRIPIEVSRLPRIMKLEHATSSHLTHQTSAEEKLLDHQSVVELVMRDAPRLKASLNENKIPFETSIKLCVRTTNKALPI